MSNASKASTVIGWIGWIIFGLATCLFQVVNQPGADVGYMGPSVKDLVPDPQGVAFLAGAIWVIAVISGLADYKAVSKTKRKAKTKALPLGLILGSVGLAVLAVSFIALRGLGS